MGNQLGVKVINQTQLVNRVESSDFQETYDAYKQGETRIVAFRPDHFEVGVRHNARTDNNLFVDINSEDHILVDELNSRSDLGPLKVRLSEYEGWEVFGKNESKEIAREVVRVWRHSEFKEKWPELNRSLNLFASNFTPERIEALGAGVGLPHEVTVVHNFYCYILQGIDIAPMTPAEFSYQANSFLANSSLIPRGLRPLDSIPNIHSLEATTEIIDRQADQLSEIEKARKAALFDAAIGAAKTWVLKALWAGLTSSAVTYRASPVMVALGLYYYGRPAMSSAWHLSQSWLPKGAALLAPVSIKPLDLDEFEYKQLINALIRKSLRDFADYFKANP